jgi:hypothetical protein
LSTVKSMSTLSNISGKIAQPLVSAAWLAEQLELQSAASSFGPKIVVLDGTWHMPNTKRSGRKEWEAERIKVWAIVRRLEFTRVYTMCEERH